VIEEGTKQKIELQNNNHLFIKNGDFKMEKNRITVAIGVISVFMMACCYISLGACSLGIMEKIDIDTGRWGIVLGVFFYSAMIVQFIIGTVTDRVGHKPISIIGFLFPSVAWFLVAIASTYSMLILAAFFLGVGAVCLNTVGNTIIPQVLFGGKDPSRASSLGNAFFGLGLFVAPLIINTAPSYGTGLLILAGISLVMFIMGFLAVFPKANLNFKFSVGFKLLVQPPVFVAAIAMMCSSGLDNTIKQWLPKVLQELGSPTAQAGMSLSIFGLAMMSGRFIFSAVKNMTAISSKIVGIAAGFIVIIIFVLTITKSVTVGMVIAGLAGLAMAPVFPSIVGMTFAKYDKEYYGSIFGMVFAIGMFFTGIVLQTIGKISSGSSVQAGLKLPVIIAVVLFIISFVLKRVKAKPVNE